MNPFRLRWSVRPYTNVLLGLLVCTTSSLFAASYYVDYGSGSDSNAGTSTTAAWRHCPGDPAAAAKPATATLQPGDTVHFKGGVVYSFTGATGIQLRWSGSAAGRITYDGNSDNSWGTGHAKFTDNYGAKGITGFGTNGNVSYLTFRTLDFGAIGGSSTLPHDAGAPVAPRFGGGIRIDGTAAQVTIDTCAFRNLGYSYTQKPMGAASINGIGIGVGGGNTVVITKCEFTNVGTAIELASATSLGGVTISDCVFRSAICWTIDMPANPAVGADTVITGCTETNNTQFAPAMWTGYGSSPRVETITSTVGTSVTLLATTAATPRAAFQWKRNGSNISGATRATLTLASVKTTDAGTYTVVATNEAGSATSNNAVLTVRAATADVNITTLTGSAETTIVPPPPASAPDTSAATSTPEIPAAAGTPGTPVASTGGSDDSAATPGTGTDNTHTATADSKLTNVSVRAHAGAGADTLIVGFVLGGDGAKPMLVRGVGPGLLAFGVSQVLPDPTLSVYSNAGLVAANAGWSSAADHDAVAAATSSVGAFELVASSADAALLPTLPAGGYTAHVASPTGATGEALVEVYDPAPTGSERLVNVSVRADVSASATPIVGFTVAGATSKKLLIRAIGPGLATFGVAGALSDPEIEIYHDQQLVGRNDNWGGSPTLSQTFAATGAFPLPDANSKDAAVVIDAAPGSYTVIVTGAGNTSGVAIAEVYELP